MIIIVSSDIDSTLIDNVHPICQSNIDAISYLKEKGVIFALCMGKSYAIITLNSVLSYYIKNGTIEKCNIFYP